MFSKQRICLIQNDEIQYVRIQANSSKSCPIRALYKEFSDYSGKKDAIRVRSNLNEDLLNSRKLYWNCRDRRAPI